MIDISHSFSQYFGLDWLIFVSNVVAVWMMGNKNRYGFLIRVGVNILWIILGIVLNSVPLVLAGIVFMGLNMRGFFKWKS